MLFDIAKSVALDLLANLWMHHFATILQIFEFEPGVIFIRNEGLLVFISKKCLFEVTQRRAVDYHGIFKSVFVFNRIRYVNNCGHIDGEVVFRF